MRLEEEEVYTTVSNPILVLGCSVNVGFATRQSKYRGVNTLPKREEGGRYSFTVLMASVTIVGEEPTGLRMCLKLPKKKKCFASDQQIFFLWCKINGGIGCRKSSQVGKYWMMKKRNAILKSISVI